MIDETILHYKIIEKLGEGGMGEVYKAQDTKLDRFVALKFLPSQLTASESDKARFIQEAKAASSMNHPNVCTIHSIEEYNSQIFISMEYIEGKTLKDKKDSLSEKQILEIGIQVAEGLAAAHEKGIVHRDIKPENIMVRKDGIVQIMDFGLAKLYSSGNVSRLTKAGTTMGTIGYMSPEQVEGVDVDHRTDIFSLGVVLYELLAGEAPFKGMHDTAVMYEIVNVEPPPISTIKEGIDPQLDGIILECLEKDKDERFQSAKELAKNLRKFRRVLSAGRASKIYSVNSQSYNVKSGQTTTVDTQRKTSFGDIPVKNLFRNIFYNPKIFWSAAAVLFIAVILLLVFSVFNKTEVEIQEIKAAIMPPHGINFENGLGSNLTISPDGKYISFIGSDSSGTTKLWVRPVNSLTARPLTNATVEAYPFWSPDSKTIAYFDRGKLMKISLDAGTSLPICDVSSGRGGSWSPTGTIVFSPAPTGGIFKVSSSGGTAEEIIKADSTIEAQSLRWAHFLPDGDHFLYSTENSATGSTPTDAIFLSSLSDTKSKKQIDASSNCQYANGYLLFVRQSILLAQKFDPDNLQLTGEAMPVTENIQYYDVRISGTFGASRNGKLIFLEENQNNNFTILLDKNGKMIKKLFDGAPRFVASFSPDGEKIAYDFYDANEKNIDIWIFDIKRNVSTRLTFQKDGDIDPQWTPDGKKITYSSTEGGVFNLYIKNADGSGNATLLFKSAFNKFITDISPDGNYLLINAINSASNKSGADILLLPQTGDKKPVKILATNFHESNASFSPNLKWIAYQSDESGKDQVYIIPFNSNNIESKASGKWQVSVDGGVAPRWMNNGKSVYFYTTDHKILAVDVYESGSSLSPGQPYVIFKPGNMNISRLQNINRTGTEIIARIPNGQSVQPPITLVANWQEELEGKK
jgi:serine/threonine protein kinase